MRIVALVLLLLLMGCAEEEPLETDSDTETVTTMSQDDQSEDDPYEVFLTNGGGDAWEDEIGGEMISREDAQARALLGCETDWAPGTIDYFLQEAYGHLCE